MNTNNKSHTPVTTCFTNYCQTTYQIDGKQLVNSYKRNQRRLSAPEVWNIQRSKREVSGTNNTL